MAKVAHELVVRFHDTPNEHGNYVFLMSLHPALQNYIVQLLLTVLRNAIRFLPPENDVSVDDTSITL